MTSCNVILLQVENDQTVSVQRVLKNSNMKDGSPQWTRAGESQEPRINTAWVINMVAREYSNIVTLNKILCADRAVLVTWY
jgi:hypothetical protein